MYTLVATAGYLHASAKITTTTFVNESDINNKINIEDMKYDHINSNIWYSYVYMMALHLHIKFKFKATQHQVVSVCQMDVFIWSGFWHRL